MKNRSLMAALVLLSLACAPTASTPPGIVVHWDPPTPTGGHAPDLAGITPRTLHHYDHIGLLHPTTVGDNGYRYYGDAAVLRLQQIMFLRELDFTLAEIQAMLDAPADKPVIFDCRVAALANCFPMIPSGKAHHEMLLGEEVSDEEVDKAVGKEGKVLV